MRILLIGGSGNVGTMILPFIRKENWVRVMDLSQPRAECEDFVQGSVLQESDLKKAVAGMEGVLYLAMGLVRGNENEKLVSSYDINVKGLHLALEAAKTAGVARAVYASTLSIYNDYTGTYLTSEEECPGNSSSIYGFTKWLGESVCRFFGEHRGMTVTALRLCGPQTLERWEEVARQEVYTLCTAAPDVADAMVRALHRSGGGYKAFFISGDYEERRMNLQAAKDLLGWQPKARLANTKAGA